MKSTKKIIIGVIAVIALLITIAGALAATEPSITGSSPSGNTVPLDNNESPVFSITVTNDDDSNLTYEWYVYDANNVQVGVQKLDSEKNITVDHTSQYTFPNSTNPGTYIVSAVVLGAPDHMFKPWSVTVKEATPDTLLEITGLDVNGKSNGKLTLSEVNEFEVEVSNKHTQDIEDVEVTVTILDVDGDDIDQDTEIKKVKKGGKELSDVLEFDLTDEDLDEDEYTIKVEVEGEDKDSNTHKHTKNFTVKVDREKDDLTITKAELEDSQVFCSANPQTSLKVKVKNVGENDQDGARITVKNSELELNLQKDNIELDDYSGSDNDYETTFPLNLEGAKTGTYTLDVTVYSEDDDQMDSEKVELQVVCADGTPSQEEQQKEEQYADKELAAELQKKIDEYRAVQESQAVAKGNFRETNSYVLLLGVLVAMMFFAAVLSATYLLVKKR